MNRVGLVWVNQKSKFAFSCDGCGQKYSAGPPNIRASESGEQRDFKRYHAKHDRCIPQWVMERLLADPTGAPPDAPDDESAEESMGIQDRRGFDPDRRDRRPTPPRGQRPTPTPVPPAARETKRPSPTDFMRSVDESFCPHCGGGLTLYVGVSTSTRPGRD